MTMHVHAHFGATGCEAFWVSCLIQMSIFTRASMANDLVKRVYGSLVPVLDGENLSVRILVSFYSTI